MQELYIQCPFVLYSVVNWHVLEGLLDFSRSTTDSFRTFIFIVLDAF